MVNDVSGLADPRVAEACAETGAALVITHTRLPPKRKGFPHYADVVEDVATLFRERADEAHPRGVGNEQIVFDPGLDLAKTPGQSVELIRRLPGAAGARAPAPPRHLTQGLRRGHDRAAAKRAARRHPRGARRSGRRGGRNPSCARCRSDTRLPASAGGVSRGEPRSDRSASRRLAAPGTREAAAQRLMPERTAPASDSPEALGGRSRIGGAAGADGRHAARVGAGAKPRKRLLLRRIAQAASSRTSSPAGRTSLMRSMHLPA